MATKVQTISRSAGDTTVVSNELQTYYVLTLIKRLLPYLPLWEDAQKVTISDRSGGFGSGVINMRKFPSLDVSTTALSEGLTPDGQDLSTSTVTTALQQYGGWIKISDVLASVAIDDVMREAMDLLGENAGRVLHGVIMNALTGGDVTQIVYGGDATAYGNIDATDVLSSTTVKKAVRVLRAANVPPYPDGYYRSIIHPYQSYDLMNDDLWVDVARYNGGAGSNGSMDLIAGEIGKMHGVRFRESTTAVVAAEGASSANTYTGFVYGPQAFGVFDLKSQAVASINTDTGTGMKIYSYPINSPSQDDPLGQWGFVSWKASFCAKVIDPYRIVRLYTGATQ